MTKADLVEKVTGQIARTAGPLISKKDCARVVDAFLDAVKAALRDRLEREQRRRGKKIDWALLRRKQEEIARLPIADDRSADQLLGYDEAGLPR